MDKKQQTIKKEITKKIEINLDLDDKTILENLNKELINIGQEIYTSNVNVIFILKKKGTKDREIKYFLTEEHYKEAERNAILPILISEILKKEFSPKIAQNTDLINFIMNELKKDPYWSTHVISLIRAIKNKEE